MKTKELRVDRIEDGVAVAYDRDGNEYAMCQKIGDLSECDVLTAKINEKGEVCEVTVNDEKTARAKSSLRQKLLQLLHTEEQP